MDAVFNVRRIAILCSILTVASFSACGSKIKLNGDSRKTTVDQRTSTNPSIDSNSQTLPPQSSPGARPAETAGPADASASNQNLLVIPPEVVSGAYLTCDFLPPEETPRASGQFYYGCSATTDEQLTAEETTRHYALIAEDGTEIDAQVVRIPGRPEDIIWQIPVLTSIDKFTAVMSVGHENAADYYIPAAQETFDTFLNFMRNFLSPYQVLLLQTSIIVNLEALWDQILEQIYGSQ